MIVPDVEGFRSKLETHALCDANVFREREIVILVAESAIVCVARAAPKICAGEIGPGLEGGYVEERFARIEIALTLREGTPAWQYAGDATDGELTWDMVAVARRESERCP